MNLIGVAEIEERYGVDRMQITRLLAAGDFPEPEIVLAAGRIWDAEAVERTVKILRREGRVTADGRIVPRRFLNAV